MLGMTEGAREVTSRSSPVNEEAREEASMSSPVNEEVREEASRSSRGPGTRVAERCDAFSWWHKWVVNHQSVPYPLQKVPHDCC